MVGFVAGRSSVREKEFLQRLTEASWKALPEETRNQVIDLLEQAAMVRRSGSSD